MGADISFYDKDGNEVFYFRDAYNSTNLAWIRALSYWSDGKTKEQQVAFFEELAAIPDEQIATHLAALCVRDAAIAGEQQVWLQMFQEKRDEIRQHLPEIRTAADIDWFV